MIVNYSNLYTSKGCIWRITDFWPFKVFYFNKTSLSSDTFDDYRVCCLDVRGIVWTHCWLTGYMRFDLTKSCCTDTGLDTVRSGKSSQTLRIPSPSQFRKELYNIKGTTIYIWDFCKCHHMISKGIWQVVHSLNPIWSFYILGKMD